MATTRATFGSVLSVITSSAGAVVSLLDNVNSGLDMLSMTVNSAKAEQVIRHKVDAVTMCDRIVSEAAMAATLADLDLLQFTAKSASHASLYADNQARFLAAIAVK